MRRMKTVLIAVAVAFAAAMAAGRAAAQTLTPDGPPVPESSAATLSHAFEAAMFYLFGGATVLSAIGVCAARKIDRMAVWLFFALGSVAALYFLLAANFVAAIQLIVYVGGVLVLLIFGIMLTSKSPWVRFDPPAREVVAAVLVCGGLLACLVFIIATSYWTGYDAVGEAAPVEAIGRSLLTRYLVPFEAAGVLLMIVMVGAAHLARQEKGQ